MFKRNLLLRHILSQDYVHLIESPEMEKFYEELKSMSTGDFDEFDSCCDDAYGAVTNLLFELGDNYFWVLKDEDAVLELDEGYTIPENSDIESVDDLMSKIYEVIDECFVDWIIHVDDSNDDIDEREHYFRDLVQDVSPFIDVMIEGLSDGSAEVPKANTKHHNVFKSFKNKLSKLLSLMPPSSEVEIIDNSHDGSVELPIDFAETLTKLDSVFEVEYYHCSNTGATYKTISENLIRFLEVDYGDDLEMLVKLIFEGQSFVVTFKWKHHILIAEFSDKDYEVVDFMGEEGAFYHRIRNIIMSL